MKIVLFFVILVQFGCSTTPTGWAAKILEADDRGVENCKFVGNVEGSLAYGGLFAQETGLKRAKIEGLEKAADLGATHLVWLNAEKGFTGADANGRAYRCP